MPFDDFKLEDYPERSCCGIFEHLTKNGYIIPFVRVQDSETGNHIGWAVSLYKSSDRRTMQPLAKDSLRFQMMYCPFCGDRIIKDEEGQRSD